MRTSKLKLLLFSILSSVAFLMQLDMVGDDVISQIVSSDSRLLDLLLKLVCSIEFQGMTSFVIVLFSYLVYKYSFSIGKFKTDEIVIGILMGITYVFGRSFDEFGTTQILITGVVQVVKTIIILSGTTMFFINLVKSVRRYACDNFRPTKCFDVENPVKYRRLMFIIIFILWGIYIIAYYPGLFMGDTEDIIHMSYNYPTGLENTVIMLSPDVYMVDHHSMLYTVIMGFFIRLGRAIFSSENTGYFIYILCQEIFTAWVLAYSLFKLKVYDVNSYIRTLLLFFYCFFPWIPQYAIMGTKDTLFADFMILYLLVLMDIVERKMEKVDIRQLIMLTGYAVIIFLLRKNGLYMIILSLPFMLMVNKKWIKNVVVVILCILAVKFVYSDIILPVAKIPDGSVSAALSIPLQQTSRYLKYYKDEVTEDEKQAIDKVVSYDTISNVYWADRSDYAKAAWRKEATSEDIKGYFIVWWKMFLKHPLTYVAATANNYYAYFYPVVVDMYEFERGSDAAIASTNSYGYFYFKASDSKISLIARNIIKLYNTILMDIPLVNMICTSALYVWLLILCWTRTIVKKDRKTLMLIVPMLMYMLTIISGPCNGNIYHRFTYPVAMAIPIVAAYAYRKHGIDTEVSQ